MRLLIDCGNTSIKYRTVSSKGHFDVLSYDQIINDVSNFSQVIYSSVAHPPQLQTLLEAFAINKIPCKKVVTEPQSFGIVCGYPKYQNLGVDRWLAIIGASSIAPDEDLIVVDAGTAMTVDILTNDRVHRGGWIVPGLTLMQESIIVKAPGVFSDTALTPEIFGLDTPTALFEGCLNSLIGAVKNAAALFESQFGRRAKIMFTGGDAEVIVHKLTEQNKSEKYSIHPDLVFHGLNQY